VGRVIIRARDSSGNRRVDYLFGRGAGQDAIYDNDSTAGVQDLVKFGADVAEDQLWFRQVGTSLEVTIIGTGDKITVTNWYSNASWRMEVFEVANGKRLTEQNVQNLVQAMASFSPPPAGQTTLSQSYQDALGSTIAANWQ
jgi:hypothetical protein